MGPCEGIKHQIYSTFSMFEFTLFFQFRYLLLLLPTLFLNSSAQFAGPGFHFSPYQDNNPFRQQRTDPFGTTRSLYTYVDPNGRTFNEKYPTYRQGFYRKPYYNTRSSFLPQITRFPPIISPTFLQPSAFPDISREFSFQNSTSISSFPPSAESLFTPGVEYPAESDGQMNNYRKALEEYAKEDEEELQKIATSEVPISSAYVRVNLGGNNNYGYKV